MGSRRTLFLLFAAALLSSATGAVAAPETTLTIGTKPAAPFAFKDENGKWTGISIDLWRQIAAELEIPYRFQEADLEGLLEGVATQRFGAGVAALTVTPEREERMDFSHPFYTTGFGIAVPYQPQGWLGVLERFFSLAFLKVMLTLCLVLLVFGLLGWFFERRRNPEQFGGPALKGVGAGFWWAAVTMTTVGYGDKAPVTLGGRIVALIWMFVAIIIISSFTAAITSSLTVSELSSRIQGPGDLPDVRVASIADSTSEKYLRSRRIAYRNYADPAAALQAVAAGEADAFVYDAPILRYLVKQQLQGRVRVLDQTFERQDYAIALPPESDLREALNRVLLEKIGSPWWQENLYLYLGR